MVGVEVDCKVKDDGVAEKAEGDRVADMVSDSGVADNVFCNREVEGGDVNGVLSGVNDMGVDGRL
jgi:hypothetical protein